MTKRARKYVTFIRRQYKRVVTVMKSELLSLT